MESKVFLKLIIPNYNNIAYIKRCLDSVFCQKFKDFFVVLVDDMSTDLSYECALAYQRRNPDRMKVIRVDEKMYAGGCRNIGMDWPVESEYTWFLDSDDWLASDRVFGLIKAASAKSPDIIRCSYIDMYGNKSRTVRLGTNVNDILKDGPGPFKTCVRTEKNVKFVPYRAKNNDTVWFMRLMDSIDDSRIACINEPCGVYNRSSVTSCQNSTEMKLKPQCIEADRLVIKDLLAEDFKKPAVIARRDRNITKFSNFYKDPIAAEDMIRHSYAITIDKQRFTRFNDLLHAVGFRSSANILFGSCDPKYSNATNCKLSHMEAVRKAKANGWPYVMIFEDDAYPCDDVVNEMNSYLNAVPKDAKLVLVGWCSIWGNDQPFTAPYTKIATPSISGSQSYILFKEGYDDFLRFHTKHPEKSADNTVFYSVKPGYIINKPLFIQYCSKKSMNNHIGYIFHGHHIEPIKGYSKIEELLGESI